MATCAISSRPNAEMHHAMPERSTSCPISSSSGTSVASCPRDSAAYRLTGCLLAAPDPLLHRGVAGALELHDLAVAERQDVRLVRALAPGSDRGQHDDHVVVGHEALRLGLEPLLGQL